MGLMETFQKQGGINLIKNYWRTGALFSTFITFLMLGKSRKALEISRLVAEYKINEKLASIYKNKVDDLIAEYQTEATCKCKVKEDRKIYFCWFQGMDNAPFLVKKCLKSLQENITDREIVVITEENYHEYVQFPDFIESKIKRGIISRTHMSDLLRLELLTRYGGTWVDATVLCTRKPPDYMLDSDFFVFQLLKPGLDGHSLGFSNWFITAKPGELVLRLTLAVLYDYWNKHDVMWDYYIFHHVTEVVRARYPEAWAKVIPFSNEVPHMLLLRLFDQYDENIWQAIKDQTPFHKLSYKFDIEDMNKENTFYSKIIKCNYSRV